MLDNQCTYEVDFELVSQPIEVNLELKTYLEKDSNYVTLYFSKDDWKYSFEDKQFYLEILPDDYNYKEFSVLDFLLYEEETDSYVSALCSYKFSNNTLMVYSDELCKCKLVLFGLIRL